MQLNTLKRRQSIYFQLKLYIQIPPPKKTTYNMKIYIILESSHSGENNGR